MSKFSDWFALKRLTVVNGGRVIPAGTMVRFYNGRDHGFYQWIGADGIKHLGSC